MVSVQAAETPGSSVRAQMVAPGETGGVGAEDGTEAWLQKPRVQYYLWGGDTCMALIWASKGASQLLPL